MIITHFTTSVPSRKRPVQEVQPFRAGKYVDLLNDKNFKLIFTKEENKQVLADMLNRFLPDVRITSLTFLPQEQNPEQKDLVSSVFDVSCETEDGKRIIVEVQYNERNDFLDRVLYYSTWPIAQQVKAGRNSYLLNDVYIVSFLNFALIHDESWEEKAVSSYSIREDSNGERMTDALHFVFVELGRFAKELDEMLDEKEWWMYSLKNVGKMEELPSGDVPQEIRRLYDITSVESLSEEEKTKYLYNMRTEFDIRTEKIMAREEGKAEGLAEGMEKGIEKGKAEGKAEGLAEGIEKGISKVASALKSMGMPVEDIAKATGLSLAEVSSI